MATEFKLSYTANEIDIRLSKIDNLAEKREIPTKTSDLTNDSGYLTVIPSEYITETELNAKGYLTEHQSLDGLATEAYVDEAIANIPTSDVSGQINAHNTATDAHGDIRASIEELGNTVDNIVVPTKVSELTNDSGYLTSIPNEYITETELAAKKYLTSYTETDPTVPAWAKASTKPTYTASEVGADASGTASSAVSAHNTNTSSHGDIRDLITGLTTRLNILANSTDEDLDQMAEIVAYIKSNKSLIDSITTSKVNVSDIINNLTTNVSNKPLSAAQGVALKALIDAIVVPTKVSELSNDKGYITSYTETDPTVPSWAKEPTKPSYTASEVGAVTMDEVNSAIEAAIGAAITASY